jgi:TonB family protein
MKTLALLAYAIVLAAAPSGRAEEALRQTPCVEGVVCKTATMPTLLKQVQPRPVHGRTGQVVLELIVGASGRVEGVRLLQGIHPDADEAAMAASLQWRFTPGICDGARVSMYFRAIITFPPPAKPGA